MLWLFVSISGLVLAQCQDDLGVINPDIIYFKDGDQRFPLNVLPILNRRIQSHLNQLQEVSLPAERLPVNLIPQLEPGISMLSLNPLKRPSPDLETPLYTNMNDQPGLLPKPVERFGEVSNEDRSNVVNRPNKPTVGNVSLALAQFSINIMKVMQKQSGNVVMSPYSIGTLLALLQQGTLGISQQQITNALQMTPDEAANGFKKLTENLQKRHSNNIFKVGNGLFLADTFNVNPAFKRVAMNDFDSDVATIKFSRPEQAAAKINTWVSGKTNNKINKLVTADNLGESTQLTLVNAVYFKGLWQVKFRPQATLPRNFYLSNGDTKSVPFMRMRRLLKVDYDPSIGSQVIVLPFEGEQYSLVIILPSESSSVAAAASSLSTESLLAYQNIKSTEVALELPKFTIKSESNLVSVFQQLGINNIFGPTADLTGLGMYREFSPQVSSALHSALLSIDEEGGVAAAATSVGAVALSYDDPSVIFVANRPFLAVLWDNQTSVPLFMAKIEDPIL